MDRQIGTEGAPVFSVEHEVVVTGLPEQVWAVLVDFERYSEWNPYVLAISGNPVKGSVLEVTITQQNWTAPLTVRPTVIRAQPNRILHWRGQIGDGGVLDTDHSFQIELLGDARVRFLQREEFRGSLAEGMDPANRPFTRDAFRAMNDALARRVADIKRD